MSYQLVLTAYIFIFFPYHNIVKLDNTNSLTNKPHTKYGGDERDRTADPLLAKQVLSQLSYAPLVSSSWWAREDLNLRPHAYQACALTN